MTNTTVEKFYIIEWIDRGAGLIEHSLISIEDYHNPDYEWSLNNGHFNGSVLEGEYTKEEAKSKIQELEKEIDEKYVAVFYNAPKGKAFYSLEGDYSGNWKGSREHPYSLYNFYSIEELGRDEAIRKASKEVDRLNS